MDFLGYDWVEFCITEENKSALQFRYSRDYTGEGWRPVAGSRIQELVARGGVILFPVSRVTGRARTGMDLVGEEFENGRTYTNLASHPNKRAQPTGNKR
jgi:hypothetical protein